MKIAESHLSVSPTVSAPSTGQESSESPRMGRGAWEECGENVGWNPGDTRRWHSGTNPPHTGTAGRAHPRPSPPPPHPHTDTSPEPPGPSPRAGAPSPRYLRAGRGRGLGPAALRDELIEEQVQLRAAAAIRPDLQSAEPRQAAPQRAGRARLHRLHRNRRRHGPRPAAPRPAAMATAALPGRLRRPGGTEGRAGPGGAEGGPGGAEGGTCSH